MFKSKGSALSKSDIDSCEDLPSYNTLNSKGLRLVELNSEFKVRLYDENPKYCKTCNTKIEYCSDIKNKIYCNSSCAASSTNKVRERVGVKPALSTTKCECCNKEFKYPTKQLDRKYCSVKCQREKQTSILVQEWLAGEHPGYVGKTKQICKFVRRYLHETRGTSCEECGWDKRHPVDGSVLTEIDHIDGDAGNNKLSNLKILCPNCHAMTPTFRARNKTSTRNRK